MSSSRKRCLSPLAMQGSRPQKVSRSKDRMEQRVAVVKRQPRESKGSVFTFGDARATSSFTFVSRHPFDEVVAPATVVPGAPASPPDTNISPFDGNNSSPRTSGSGAHGLDDIPADEEPMAGPMAVVTPELSNSPTPEFYPNAGGTIGENVSVDDPMECTTDVGSPPEVMSRESAPIAGETSNERSELSYVSYSDAYVTDRSIVSPSLDDPGTDGTTPRGRRSPYIAISSREHSLYQARRRGSDGSLVGLLDAVDALQRLSNSNRQIANLPTGQDIQASNQLIDIKNQITHPSGDPQDEATDPATSASSLPNVMGVQDVAGPTGTPHPFNAAAKRGSRGPFICDVYGSPPRVEGTRPSMDPHPSADPHSRADAENVTTSAPGHSVNDATAPAHDPIPEDAIPPPVDTRAPPVPPLRPVRARGVFIVGNGAPVRIDEGIEVHLRDGTDGRIDFII